MDEVLKKLCEDSKESLKSFNESEGLQRTNIQIIGQLVDIVKDLKNIEYWERKEEFMRDSYGRDSYGRDAYGRDAYGRDAYGRDAYGARRRDSRGRYMGYDHLDRMSNEYGRYEEGRESYNTYGNYGAKEDGLKSYKFMLESAVDFFKMLKEEAGSPEEHQMLNEYAQKIMREVSV